jgi:hypothetical protein
MDAEESFVIERRRRPRRAVASPTRLRPNDWSTTQVDVVDISEDGFRGDGEVSFRIGAFVSLQIPGIGWVEGTIVWQHLNQFGARFVIPVDLGHCAWTSTEASRDDAALGRQLASRVMLDERRSKAG